MAISNVETTPVAHESIRFAEDNLMEVLQWLGAYGCNLHMVVEDKNEVRTLGVAVIDVTRSNCIRVSPGQYIVRRIEEDSSKEPYPVKVYSHETYHEIFRSAKKK